MSLLIRTMPRTAFAASSLRHELLNPKFQAIVIPRLPLVKARMMADMTTIYTEKAMKPVGPYSQAIKTPHAIYCSGQLAASADGTLTTGTIAEKTAQILQNLSVVLEAAGSSLSKVVKVNVFLVDMNDFKEMNEEYGKWLMHKPARSCVAVKELPKGVSVEIDCVALP